MGCVHACSGNDNSRNVLRSKPSLHCRRLPWEGALYKWLKKVPLSLCIWYYINEVHLHFTSPVCPWPCSGARPSPRKILSCGRSEPSSRSTLKSGSLFLGHSLIGWRENLFIFQKSINLLILLFPSTCTHIDYNQSKINCLLKIYKNLSKSEISIR